MSSPMPDLTPEQLNEMSAAMARTALVEAVRDLLAGDDAPAELEASVDKAARDLVWNLDRPDASRVAGSPSAGTERRAET